MATTPLLDFVNIGNRTSVYTPDKYIRGQLIILCPWLGAGQKPIVKYVALFQQIAPTARILLIESAIPSMISSYVKQRRDIQPAATAVIDTLLEFAGSDSLEPGSTKMSTTPKILLQTFSNGGTNTAAQLLFVLRERLQAPLPLTGLICDSGPAKGEYWRFHKALVLSLPPYPVSCFLGTIAAHCIMIVLSIWIAMGNEPPPDFQRRVLLSSHYVQGTSLSKDERATPSVGRNRKVCYLYSKVDEMCFWTYVSEHAREARDQGWQVKEAIFENSGHCAHYQKHGEQYTNLIKDMWKD